jgi:hypothetical protein
MRKEIFYVLTTILLFSLHSCSKDENSPYTYSSESTIYSDYETIAFKEVLFIAEPFIVVDGQKKYLVADCIYNISIKVNNAVWGTFQSLTVDTSHIENKESIDKYLVANNAIKYSVIAPQQSDKDTLTTAGEYADLINNFLTLKPGYYIFQIEYFDIKLSDSEIKRVYPMITVPIEVKENVKSSFLGEYEIEIKY